MNRKFILLIITIFLSYTFVFSAQSGFCEPETAAAPAGQEESGADEFRRISYENYLRQYAGAPSPSEEIIIDAVNFKEIHDMEYEILDRYEGSQKKSLKTGDIGYVVWEVDVEKEGLYNIAFRYYPVKGKDSSIERELRIDGELPFEESRSIVFQRIWTNGDPILQDRSGNEYRPKQIESPRWIEAPVSGHSGYYDSSYKYYFTRGKHTIELYSIKEPMLIESIRLYQEEEIPTYEEIKALYEQKGYRSADKTVKTIKIQGESAIYKSDPTLYPVPDHSSPLNEPYSVAKIWMNSIGGINWRYQKQWLEWEFDVETEGLYKIGIRAKQNFISGTFSSRKIYIDGKVPFKEAENIKVKFSDRWNIVEIGDEEPYLFYLEKGRHTLRLEVSLGDLSSILRTMEQSIYELTGIYRKILMVTGSFPDLLRDYNIDEKIPNAVEIFDRNSKILYEASEKLAAINGKKGQASESIERMAVQLEGFVKDMDTVPRRLTKFNENISTLGNWLLSASEQPLLIDYIVIAPPEAKLPKAEAGFFGRLFHEIKAFFYTFVNDYSVIGDSGKAENSQRKVTLWIGSQGQAIGSGGGRDQAQVIKSLIDNTFTPETDIRVDLKLVDMSVLLRAVAAGRGPDVAIYQHQSAPVNYAFRGALQDLMVFPDIEDVLARFAPSAVEPFRIGESVYALPEQQWFPMMFYRKDIFNDLGISPPDTWDDLYAIIPVLQLNHLEITLPTPMNTIAGGSMNPVFMALLYQNGGQLYNQERSRCVLDSREAVEAFSQWIEMFTKYKIPLKANEITRFRMGESPLIIAPYTFYNSLVVAAPEIRGLWDMVPVPGTKLENGEIRRDVSCEVYGAVMFKNAKDKEAAWEFLKWWTSSDTQVSYGQEMESLQGPSARWPTANLEAMENLPWPAMVAKSIQTQWAWVQPVPEVAGGYLTSRNVDNAARKTINDGENPTETLLDYVKGINDEIELKRKEFGLE